MENIGKPLGDRVLVKPAPKNKERKTESGLFIPDSAMADEAKYAEVVAVGEGLFTQTGTPIPMCVKVGDIVILPSYHQGQDIKLNGVDYIILRESEMLMVL
jgi:chaperonin GroES